MAEGGRRHHCTGEHDGICFAWPRIGSDDSFDLELVAIAATD